MRRRALFSLVAAGFLGSAAGQRAPSGFIEATMEWNFTKEYSEGDVTDEGYCSTRLDFSNGKVRAIHRYERQQNLKRSEYDKPTRQLLRGYRLKVYRTFSRDSTSREPSAADPIVMEYPAIARLVKHPDGSVTATFRPQLKTFRVAEYDLEWRTDQQGKVLTSFRAPVNLTQGSCDAIDKLQSALRARHETLGAFPSLRDTATVASMFTPAIPATIHGRWDLRP